LCASDPCAERSEGPRDASRRKYSQAEVLLLRLRMTGPATLAAVSAAISPWAFQFSRIAWDPAVAPMYISWALAALLFAVRDSEGRRKWVTWIAIAASALLFGAACLCYPPLRMQVPLVLLAFVVWKRRWVREHLLLTCGFVAVFVAATAQLWLLTINGTIQGRFDELSVFGASYWIQRGVTTRGGLLLNGAWLFAKNFFAHFAPSYLLISGDANLRHSTQMFGEWSWLDALAIVAAGVVLVRRRRRPGALMNFAAFGYIAGVLPSALTWEGVPHALRSIGALPFLCILVAGAITTVADDMGKAGRFLPVATAGIAFVFLAAFVPVFFVAYPPQAADMFDAPAAEKLSQPELARMLASPSEEQPMRTSGYPTLPIQYYELRAGAIRCERK